MAPLIWRKTFLVKAVFLDRFSESVTTKDSGGTAGNDEVVDESGNPVVEM
jgi:hypothetical protein